MSNPLWMFRSLDAHLQVTVDPQKYDNTTIYLTDARRVGIMLRDSRLTLRDHAALTSFIVEAVDGAEFVLKTPAIEGDNSYVSIGDKGVFTANASRDNAQKFQFKVTDLGVELYLEDQRPAVFDVHYDVSIGKLENGRSSIPILIHTEVSSIWASPAVLSTQAMQNSSPQTSTKMISPIWPGW